MLHTVSVFSYTVRLHNLSLRHHCHLSVCTVLTKYKFGYLGLILSILLTQTVAASFSSKSITPVQFTCRTLCYHAQMRYGAVCLQTACSASSSCFKPVVENMHSTRTDEEDIERYTAATWESSGYWWRPAFAQNCKKSSLSIAVYLLFHGQNEQGEVGSLDCYSP